MLGFMAVSGVLGWLNIRNLQLQVQVPDEIYCSLPTQLTITLRNRRRLLPSYLLIVTVSDQPQTVTILPRGKTVSYQALHSFPVRGPGRINRAYVCSFFPVNFFTRCQSLPLAVDYLVFPRPQRSVVIGYDDPPQRQGESPNSRTGNDGDLARIGVYTGAEPLKLIHWRLSARHDELKVKELSAITGKPLVINLDEVPGTVEERLAGAAYLVNLQLRCNRPVGLRIGQRFIPPGIGRQHRLLLLGELARHGIH